MHESLFVCNISFKAFTSSQDKKGMDEDEKGKEIRFTLRLLRRHREPKHYCKRKCSSFITSCTQGKNEDPLFPV